MKILDKNIQAYKLLFIFENNLRRFIKNELDKYYEGDWLNKIDEQVKKTITTQTNSKINYLTSDIMDKNPLNYTLTNHLSVIMLNRRNWENLFSGYFTNLSDSKESSKQIVKTKYEEISKMRNYLMHSNLTDEDFLTQLQANINFFRKYIKPWDEYIYSIAPSDKKLENAYSGVLECVNSKRNIPDKIMKIIQVGDSEVYDLLKGYNKLSKLAADRNYLIKFISNHDLVNIINDKTGE